MNITELAAIFAVIVLFGVCLMLAAAGCDVLVEYLLRPMGIKRKSRKKRRKTA